MGPSTITVPVEISADLLEFVGSPEVIAVRLRQALVMDLVFDDVVSQGRTADILGISIGEMLDLIAKYQSRQNGLTAAEILEEVSSCDISRAG